MARAESAAVTPDGRFLVAVTDSTRNGFVRLDLESGDLQGLRGISRNERLVRGGVMGTEGIQVRADEVRLAADGAIPHPFSPAGAEGCRERTNHPVRTSLLRRAILAITLATLAGGAFGGPALAHGPNPLLGLGTRWHKDQIVGYQWSPFSTLQHGRREIDAAAEDVAQSRGSRAALVPADLGRTAGSTTG